jgi:hypothetical protein
MIEEISKLHACSEALKWLRGQKTPEEAWAKCDRADWMIWLAMKKAGAPGWSPWQDVALLLCDITEPLVKGLADSRPLAAIGACRAFVAGEIPRSSLFQAAHAAAHAAAYAATYAAYAAAHAAAYAADATATAAAATTTADAAYAATATATATAAAAAATATYAGAKDTALAEMADLLRERLTLGEL